MKLELNKEYPQPNEAELTRKLTALLLEMLQKSYLTRHQRNLTPLREPDAAGNYPNLNEAASTAHL